MAVRRPQQFLAGSLVLSLVGVCALVLTDSLSLATVVVCVVVATLVATEATAPGYVRPPWRRRLRLALLVALLAFGVVVGERAIALWPTSV
jgi:hypothetical protein